MTADNQPPPYTCTTSSQRRRPDHLHYSNCSPNPRPTPGGEVRGRTVLLSVLLLRFKLILLLGTSIPQLSARHQQSMTAMSFSKKDHLKSAWSSFWKSLVLQIVLGWPLVTDRTPRGIVDLELARRVERTREILDECWSISPYLLAALLVTDYWFVLAYMRLLLILLRAHVMVGKSTRHAADSESRDACWIQKPASACSGPGSWTGSRTAACCGRCSAAPAPGCPPLPFGPPASNLPCCRFPSCCWWCTGWYEDSRPGCSCVVQYHDSGYVHAGIGGQDETNQGNEKRWKVRCCRRRDGAMQRMLVRSIYNLNDGFILYSTPDYKHGNHETKGFRSGPSSSENRRRSSRCRRCLLISSCCVAEGLRHESPYFIRTSPGS